VSNVSEHNVMIVILDSYVTLNFKDHVERYYNIMQSSRNDSEAIKIIHHTLKNSISNECYYNADIAK
jgi:hypothetical protein